MNVTIKATYKKLKTYFRVLFKHHDSVRTTGKYVSKAKAFERAKTLTDVIAILRFEE